MGISRKKIVEILFYFHSFLTVYKEMLLHRVCVLRAHTLQWSKCLSILFILERVSYYSRDAKFSFLVIALFRISVYFIMESICKINYSCVHSQPFIITGSITSDKGSFNCFYESAKICYFSCLIRFIFLSQNKRQKKIFHTLVNDFVNYSEKFRI